MKDATSASFGLVIAFVLPGLIALCGLPFVSPTAWAVSKKVLEADSDVGLFVLVLLASIAVSLWLHIPRFIVFEKLICRKHCLSAEDFKKLCTSETHLETLRAMAEE